jgi:hypothetical protein
VRVNILDEYCKHLGTEPDLRGAEMLLPGAVEHDPGVAEMHLRTGDGLPVAVMLDETE